MARALLLAFLLSVVLAATCEVVTYSGGEYIVPLVYSEKGYTPFTGLKVIPAETGSVEQNRMIYIEGGNVVYETSVGDTAVDPSEGLFTTTAIEGPFLFVYKVNDTIRIARDIPGNPTWDSRRNERYEGRFEEGGLGVLSSFGETLNELIKSFTGYKIKGKGSIKNYFTADEYDVLVTCASTACQKEIYSLLTKYMNIGASGEMIVEALSHSLGFAFKEMSKKVRDASKKMVSLVGRKIGGEEFGEQLAKKIDDIVLRLKKLKRLASEKADEIIDNMDTDKKQAVEAIFLGERVPKIFTRDELLAIYVKMSEAKEGFDFLKKWYDLIEISSNLVEAGESEKKKLLERARQIINEIKNRDVKNELEKIESLSKVFGKEKWDETKIKRDIIDKKSIIEQELSSILKDIRNIDNEGMNEEILLGIANRLSVIKNELTTAKEFYTTYAARLEEIEHMSPLLVSQYALLSDAAHSFVGEKEKLIYPTGKSFVAGGLVAPALFYIARKGPSYFFNIGPSKTNFTSDTLGSFGYPIVDSYSLPPEWSQLKIQPLKDRDAMVDIIVNGGSDPGDVFKAYMSLLPMGLVSNLVKKYTGVDVAGSLGFIETEEEKKMRETGPAIVAVATDPSCKMCRATASSRRFSIFSPQRLSLAITEDSKEGSTAILFFRRSNLLGPDGTIIDMGDPEKSCLKKCRFMKYIMSNRVIKYILADPVKDMFIISILFGYVAPVFVGGGIGAFVVQPAVGMYLYGGCQTCIDDVFGYYLHVRAPEMDVNSDISDSFLDSLKTLGLDIDVNAILVNMKKEEAEKKQVMVYVNLSKASGILEGKLIAEASKPTNALPVEERRSTLVLEGENGSVVLEGKSISLPSTTRKVNLNVINNLGKLLSVTTDKGTYTQKDIQILPNGKVIIDGNDVGTLKSAVFEKGVLSFKDGSFYLTEKTKKELPADLAVPDTKIPGIIIPTVLVRSRPGSDIILEAKGPEKYILDASLETCLRENGIKAGILKQVVMEEGVVNFGEKIDVVSEKWSGEASLVRVYSNGDVTVVGKTITEEKNELKIKVKEIKVGKLKAIVFDDLTLMRKGIDIIAWKKRAADVPNEAVGDAKIKTDGKNLSMEVIPSPDATQEEIDDIKKINKEMNSILAIDGENVAVALVDKDGKKVLRIIDKKLGKVEEGEVIGMENTENGVKIKIVDVNGNEKEHIIKIDVTSSGAPVLNVDGKDGGIVRTVQTPDKFLFYDPEKGWQLINGVLAPLAEAFKNGIQINFNGGLGVARPGNSVIINYPRDRGGFSLPFMGDLIILLPLGFALLYRRFLGITKLEG